MRAALLIALLALPGCFAWAFADSQNDTAHAKYDAPRCAADCKTKGAATSFELPSERVCGCQYADGTFSYSSWPQ